MSKSKNVLNVRMTPCRIATSVSCRREKHGDENVPACDITITGLMLDEKQLNSLLGDDVAHPAIFNVRAKDRLPEPLFPQLEAFRLKDKFEGCTAKLKLHRGSDDIIELADVKFAKVRIEPQVGGLTLCTFTIQCTPEGRVMGKIFDRIDSEIDGSFTFGPREEKDDRQGELAINSFGEGEEGDEKPARRGRKSNGDQPAAH